MDAENSDRITDAAKRLIIEKRVQKHLDFQLLPRLQQKKILTIESNLFFFKHSADEIVDIAKIAKEIKEYDFKIKNKKTLTIEIYRKIPINIGYLLSALSHLSVANMEIFTLFDEVKYFRIDFIQNVDGSELVEVEEIIDNSFDMTQEVLLRNVEIKRDEIKKTKKVFFHI
jgi:[protein-PII] uridylyltransferase